MSRYQQSLIAQLKSTSSIIEQYELVSDLVTDGVSCIAIARQSGLADYHIRHLARLHHKLNAEVRALFLQGKLSFSMARAIAGLPNKQQENVARRTIAKGISVQSLRMSLSENQDKNLVRDLERLSEQASALSGLDITIIADKNNSHAGSWVIRYSDLDMFDTIVEKITGKASLVDSD